MDTSDILYFGSAFLVAILAVVGIFSWIDWQNKEQQSANNFCQADGFSEARKTAYFGIPFLPSGWSCVTVNADNQIERKDFDKFNGQWVWN